MIEPNRRSLTGASLQMGAYGIVGGLFSLVFMGAPLWAPLAAGLLVAVLFVLIGWVVLACQKGRGTR